MRILLLGEYSNVHATLALGLRGLGHEVTVASNGDFWKDYPRDQDLARRQGKLGGLALMAKVYSLLPRWRGYDVVQLINPMFLELKAERIAPVYRYLRRHNAKMVLCALGMDYYWVSECTFRKPLRYSDFNIGDRVRTDEPAVREQRDWLGTAKEKLNKMIAQDCDAIVASPYENYVCYEPYYSQKLHFFPFPITSVSNDTSSLRPVNAGGPIRFFIGISKGRSAYKGTDVMLRALEKLKEAYPQRVEILKAEGVPFDTYQHMMDSSDVLLDQLYSYTPAMNALLAMSKGIVVVGGGEEEGYQLLGEDALRPIVNVQPSCDSVYNELENLVLHPERVLELKRQSIEFVSRHHDYVKVARLLENIYKA
jgi:hypothetical protein